MPNKSQKNEQAVKIAEILYQVLFFNIFSVEELSEIASDTRLIKWKNFNSKDKIFLQGSYDQHFYIVLKGEVEIERKDPHQNNIIVNVMKRGDLFGEMVVISPGTSRRGGAFASKKGGVLLCEIDATLIDTVTILQKSKFLKKFFDLILDRLNIDDRKIEYYQNIIQFGKKNEVLENDFFQYTIASAIDKKNLVTQYIKYTDFLISKKIDPSLCVPYLQQMLEKANIELDKTFRMTKAHSTLI